MSKELIDALAKNDNVSAEDIFKSTMVDKVGSALEGKRKDLAKTFVKSMTVEPSYEDKESNE